MIEKPSADTSFFLLFLYALAAVTGGLGGCAVWARRVSPGKRWGSFLIAYLVVGIVMGLTAASLMLTMNREFTINHSILFGLLSGIGGAFAVFGVNWGAGVAFRWKNFEARFTLRERDEERRCDPEDRECNLEEEIER